MLRAGSYVRAGASAGTPFDLIALAHDERRLRRKLLTLARGDEVLVDLPQTVAFETGDVLVLDDGRFAEIVAAEEPLYEIRGRDAGHLVALAWHLGNRHLPAQIDDGRILIRRDHVIRDMLAGLGATVSEITGPFSPLHGAYHQGHDHALVNR